MGSTLATTLRTLRCAAVAFALVSSISTGAFAACSTGAASPQKVADFLANPASILNGGSNSEISAAIRDLVVSDPATLPGVIGLLKGTPAPTSDLQKAIGTGLGLAASICIRPDPTFAAEIQSQLAATDSTDAKQQYAAVTGNQLIGAVGGGGGGGGAGSAGASGGQTSALFNNTGNGALQTFTANSVSNSPTNYFTGGVAGISAIQTATAATSPSTP